MNWQHTKELRLCSPLSKSSAKVVGSTSASLAPSLPPPPLPPPAHPLVWNQILVSCRCRVRAVAFGTVKSRTGRDRGFFCFFSGPVLEFLENGHGTVPFPFPGPCGCVAFPPPRIYFFPHTVSPSALPESRKTPEQLVPPQ